MVLLLLEQDSAATEDEHCAANLAADITGDLGRDPAAEKHADGIRQLILAVSYQPIFGLKL